MLLVGRGVVLAAISVQCLRCLIIDPPERRTSPCAHHLTLRLSIARYGTTCIRKPSLKSSALPTHRHHILMRWHVDKECDSKAVRVNTGASARAMVASWRVSHVRWVQPSRKQVRRRVGSEVSWYLSRGSGRVCAVCLLWSGMGGWRCVVFHGAGRSWRIGANPMVRK
jgi:hypothetical protein